ncbi:MAG: hypothetical protein PHF84_12810 [bacterium]|nr:hypothetical protein [bacterium]
MTRPVYFKDLIKQFIWTFFDNITKIFSVSALWFILNLPVFYTIYVLLYSRITHPFLYAFLAVIVYYSPFSFGAGYYISQIISQMVTAPKFTLPEKILSMDMLKLSYFFRGTARFFWKSLAVILMLSLISLLLYLNLYFYWKIVTPRIPLLGLILTGFILWVIVIFLLMNNYLLPLLLTRETSIFRALSRSFLLVMDNVLYSLGLFLLLASFFIIMGFTMLGLLAVYSGTYILLQFLSFFIIYQKYDETIELVSETRAFKNLFKPWK